jgi:hypothetical protein
MALVGSLLTMLVVRVLYMFTSKDFNQVANELAIFARRNSHTAVWVGQAPA